MSAPPPGVRLRLDKAVCLKSGCKINVHLEITGLLPHGRHSIYTHMLPLDEPHDEMLLRPPDAFAHDINPSNEPKCLTLSDQEGINPLDNTMTLAHALFARKFPALPDLAVELHKGVPLGAGLGGGSANAAALLLFLNDFMQKHGHSGLTRQELLNIAAQVGADVPFFILNLPAEASGTGTTLKPNPAVFAPFAGMHLVLLCPGIHVSTAWAYAAWDKMRGTSACYLTKKKQQDKKHSARIPDLYNSFEQPVFSAFPQLAEIKNELLAEGAEAALMSGSGSSIFGFFSTREAAENAGEKFIRRGLRVYIRVLYAGASPSW